jgi:hypothetical protein
VFFLSSFAAFDFNPAATERAYHRRQIEDCEQRFTGPLSNGERKEREKKKNENERGKEGTARGERSY